jgi:protease-4
MKSKGRWIILLNLLLFAVSGFFLFLAVVFFLGKEESVFTPGNSLAVVEIKGPIFESKEIVEQLDRVYDNDSIKGLILRIDSPGGAVSPSQEIYQAVLRVKEKKKVIASMGTVAASGGYYIAVAADKIVANPGTITGSIGVLMDYTNVEELLRFLKIHAELLTAGKMKDIGSALRPLKPEERQYLMGILDDMHLQFKEAVQKGRQLTDEQLQQLADGRILTGKKALEVGLVDKLGSLQTAVDLAKEILEIPGKPKLLYPKKKRINYLELLMEGDAESAFWKLFYTLRQGRALYWTKGMSL